MKGLGGDPAELSPDEKRAIGGSIPKGARPQPWERQGGLWDAADGQRMPADTDRSWAFFKAYRDLKGPRRLDRIRFASPGGGLGPTLAELKELHDTYGWRERVTAYDQHMDSVAQEEAEAIVRHTSKERMAEHLGLCQDALELASAELAKYIQASREGSAQGLLKVGEIAKLMELGIKLGRLVKGESTESVEVKGDLVPPTAEEIAAWELLTGSKNVSGN